MATLDYSTFAPWSIGFDRLFDLVSGLGSAQDNYPPYDIVKTAENSYQVKLAVAGFTENELSVTQQPGVLTISGCKAEPKDGQYLWQGIAGRSFVKHFNLAGYVTVQGAHTENGMLIVDLVRELPEELKPRKIEIATGPAPKQIESKLAA